MRGKMNYIKATKSLDENKIQTMNIILNERSKGKSRKQCAEIAEIKNQRIQNWYTEGKHGIGKENILFYKNLKKIEDNLTNEKYAKDIKLFKRSSNYEKRDKFLTYIRKGHTRKEASQKANIKLYQIDRWNYLGKKGIKPFERFHNEYLEARNYIKNKKSRITVIYNRSQKTSTDVTIKGLVKNSEAKEIYNNLRFFSVDLKRKNEMKTSNKTKIELIYNIDISLLEKFENILKRFEFKVVI